MMPNPVFDKCRDIINIYSDSKLPIIITDIRLNIVYKNQSAEKLFPSKFSDTVNMMEMYPDSDAVIAALTSGKSISVIFPRLDSPCINAVFTPIVSEGKSIGAVLNPSFAESEDTTIEKETLFSEIAHAFRSPLTAMFSSLSLMGKSDYVYDNFREQLQNINDHGYEMLRNSINITEYGKLKNYPESAPKNLFDLSDFLRELCTAVQAITVSSTADFSFVLPPNPVFVRGRAEFLSEGILNVLSNAFKFTPSSSSVCLEMKTNSSKTDAVIIIRDLGSGMSSKSVMRACEPFYSDTQKLGLGLTVAKLAVESFGGTLSLSSVQGGGTTVTMSLPIAKYDKSKVELMESSSDYLENSFSLPFIILSDAIGAPEI